MNPDYVSLQEDIRKIENIPVVPTMLEVICRATGMGFAAIARVTEDRWIACSVRDEINFGLEPGGELEVQTTICDEIRNCGRAVVIDEVSADPHYVNHHTPKMYGFQSYISVPIVLNTGEFFGTLCAIDPKPAKVSDLKITGMFTMFAQLIAFHLQTMETLETTRAGMQNATDQLAKVEKQNFKFEYLTYHSLRQPVRKLCIHSDRLLHGIKSGNSSDIQEQASIINKTSLELATMLQELDIVR